MATLYAKAAGGNWSAAGTWSTTGSGGGDSSGPPTAADDVVFQVGSGAVTVDAGAVCRSIDTNAYTNTLTHSSGVTLTIGDGTAGAGNIAFRFGSGMTYTKGSTTTSAIAFVSTSATQQTITTNGKILGNVTFNGSGSSYLFSDNFSANGSTSTTLTLTTGTLNMNGKTVALGRLSSTGTGTRTLTLGAATITTNSVWDFTDPTNLTFNANTSSITQSGGNFFGGGKTFNTVAFTLSTSIIITGANTYATLTITGVGQVRVRANQVVSGTLTITGNDAAVSRIWVLTGQFYDSTNFATQYTITAAAKSLTNVDFTSIIAAGAASPFTGTSLGNGGNCSNITFTTPVTRYWVGNGGNWSSTTHWSTSTGGGSGASVPLLHDTVVFDGSSISSGSQTITMDVPRVPSLDFTNITNTPTLSDSGTNREIFGSLKLITGMNVSLTGWFNFISFTPITLTSAGKTITEIDVYTPSTTLTLQDNLLAEYLYLEFGTFDANGNNVTLKRDFYGDGYDGISSLKMGSGIWVIGGYGNTCTWITTGTGIINAQTSTIRVQNSNVSVYFYDFSNSTYYNLEILPAHNGGYMEIDNSGTTTFNSITFGASAYVFIYGNTSIVATTYVCSGSSGNHVRLEGSSIAGISFSKSSGTVTFDYVIMKYIQATGGAIFNAGENSGDGGGNTGWNFASSTATTTKRQLLVAGSSAATSSSGLSNTLNGGQEGGSAGWINSLTGRTFIVPVEGILKQTKLFLGAAPSGGTFNWRVQVYDKDGNFVWSQSTGASSDQFPVLSLNIPVSPGYRCRIQYIIGGSPTAVTATWVTEFLMYSKRFVLGDGSFTLWGNDNTRRYHSPASGGWFEGVTTAQHIPVPIACTLRELFVNLSTSPGAGKSYILSIYKNGSEEASTILTVSDSAFYGSLTGLNVAFAAGDTVMMSFISSGTPASNPSGDWSLSFEPTGTDGESFVGTVATSNLNTGATAYAPIASNGHTWSTTEADRKRYIAVRAVTLKNMRILLDGSPGAGKSYAFTVRKNGAGTAITATIADAATSANDTTHTVDIAEGDYIDIECVPSGTPTARKAEIGLAMVTSSPVEPITKSLKYTVLKSLTITKTLIYKVKAPVTITKSLKYTTKSAHAAITKSLKYTVKTTPSTITKSLKYTVVKSITIQKTLIYKVRAFPTITKSLKYTTKAPVTITKSLKYTILKALTITKSLTYAIRKDVYSREVDDTLQANDLNLDVIYTEAERTDVATDDGTYVDIQGTTDQYALHQFKEINANDTDALVIHWNGKTTVAGSLSTIYLQIYNRNTTTWETLDSNNSVAVLTDFDLDAMVTSNLSDYYDADNLISVRVYQLQVT